MDSSEIFNMLISLVGATLFGIIGVVALGWFVDLQKRSRKWLLALIYPIIILAMAGGALLSNRNVAYSEFESLGVDATSPVTTWFFRLITALIFAICVVRLMSASQKAVPRKREGRALFMAFLFFYFTNVILNNIFGANPEFHERFLGPIIVFMAVYFSRNQDKRYSTEGMKWGLLLLFMASYAVAAVLPTIAIQLNYMGYLPGLNIRLWGLGTNPNSIGPLAVIFLLLVFYSPFKKRWMQYFALLVGTGILLLSQSKTAWIAGSAAFGMFWWTRHVTLRSSGRRGSYYSVRDFAIPILVCVIGIAMIAGVAFLKSYEAQIAAIDSERQLTTLTGRTEIWTIAINTWKDNPVFGYGSSIWGQEFRQSINMDAALTAHSQFLQSLSEAGTVGFIGLLIYIAVLWRYARAANRQTQGLSLALFTFLIVRSFTETPLDVTTIFTGEFLTHLLLFRLVLVKAPQQYAATYMHGQQQLNWGRT